MPSVSERLLIGQRVEVQVANAWLPTRLEGIDGDARFTVAWPTDRERRLAQVNVGDTIELAGSGQDALYSAAARVTRTVSEGVPLIQLQVTGEWRRSQRRDAVRVPVAI